MKSQAKVSKTIALDKAVAVSVESRAKKANRSFSNYVETVLAAAMSEDAKRKSSTK